jgi:energy-coupling factor transporter ATP-binding protein EcfA2
LFQQWWKSQPWLQRNSLIAVANSSFDGASGLQHDDGLKDTRDEIYRFSHIVFSSRPADRDFFLGKTHGLHYGSPKPCLHGSDAHSIAKLFRPDDNRYCWIKADPTFEGLRQTLYEPEDRVAIGEQPPRHYDPDSVIDSITFRNTGQWFEERTLHLNSGLVAIVGLKGSGKTALADMLAFSTATEIDPTESFISRAAEHLNGLEIDLTWASGATQETVTLPEPPLSNMGSGTRYLSQKFVDRLCTGDELTDELLREIEDVIFDYIPRDERFGATDFRELREIRTGGICSRRNELASQISQLSREIGDLDRKRLEIRAKRKRQEELSRSIDNLKRSRPKASDEAVQAKLREVAVAKESRDKLADEVAELRRHRQLLDDLKRKLSQRFQETVSFWREMRTEFSHAKFTPEEVARLEPRLPENWQALFLQKTDAIAVEVVAKMGYPNVTATPVAGIEPKTIADWNRRVEGLEKEIKLDGALKKQIFDSQAQEQRFAVELERVAQEFKWLAEKYPEDRQRKQDERRAHYLVFFDLLAEERSVLVDLYRHLSLSLAGKGRDEQKLELVCRVEIGLAEWVQRGEDLFDLRRQGPFDNGLAGFARRHLEAPWRSCDKDAIGKAMDSLIELIKDPEMLRSQLRANVTLLNVAEWLFSVDHISITYGIRYDGKDLRLLSPGTKGIVLLILYLAIDSEDHRPLIVDQPDENLDNQSVFETLRGYFREAKKRRQVIIITHNPNLVVNTDAEQVIIAHCQFGADGLPAITYSLGSLEALTADGPMQGSIRDEVCRVLEGGREAFKMRERRYGEGEVSLLVEGTIRPTSHPAGHGSSQGKNL